MKTEWRGSAYIRAMLRVTGISQAELAKELGKSQGHLNQYINLERMEEHHMGVVKHLETKVKDTFNRSMLTKIRKEL